MWIALVVRKWWRFSRPPSFYSLPAGKGLMACGWPILALMMARTLPSPTIPIMAATTKSSPPLLAGLSKQPNSWGPCRPVARGQIEQKRP
jgi:hypothetical protein